MALLWENGATTSQKISGQLLLLLAISTLIYFMFFKDFLPSQATSIASLYSSAGATTLTLIWIALQLHKNHWKPNNPEWGRMSTIKKVATIIICPFILFFIFWINLNYAIPRTIAITTGHTTTTEDDLLKTINHTRYSCDFRLKSEKFKGFLFELCVSESFFNKLPQGLFKAKLEIVESPVGIVFRRIAQLESR
ncbi:hypothetical protein NVV93_11950 [Pseudomonas sp. LS44]|uniref:hypothetical protein n=1 Tax=Pseudomonas sp. LS44 TaxID=1357074 RepID=UPI00215A3A3E|nr:hypothetical protein [Pseudomonas sp. LS44]UVE16326.1 hypothetical protein NVV93_11950 [Pseudomonas sp. LS44]